jgi:para-aminobenzoate synthetase component 1
MQLSPTIEIPYKADSLGWADQFADLPGFVFLDSRKRQQGVGNVDIISALPDRLYNLVDYSYKPKDWIAAIEQDLANTANPEATIAIGFLDFETTVTELGVDATCLQPACAGLFLWHLWQDHAAQRAFVAFSESTPETTKRRVQERLFDDDFGPWSQRFQLSAPFAPDISPQEFKACVEQIRAYISAGDCYQVNFAHRFATTFTGDLFGAYRLLRSVAPGDFSAYLHLVPDHKVLSLSPERFLAVDGGQVTTQPIKGTSRRSPDPTEDRRLADALRHSAKDRAENVMIVDLLRNDLGRLCTTGSVHVPALCDLQSFDNVHHLVSTVVGTLSRGVTAGQALIGCSPGGSITGAPKRRAVEIIKELETAPRGIYCGSVFACKASGWLHSSIAIRTLEAWGDRLYCWGGGGITFDSTAEAEYQETLDKVRVFMQTLENQ